MTDVSSPARNKQFILFWICPLHGGVVSCKNATKACREPATHRGASDDARNFSLRARLSCSHKHNKQVNKELRWRVQPRARPFVSVGQTHDRLEPPSIPPSATQLDESPFYPCGENSILFHTSGYLPLDPPGGITDGRLTTSGRS